MAVLPKPRSKGSVGYTPTCLALFTTLPYPYPNPPPPPRVPRAHPSLSRYIVTFLPEAGLGAATASPGGEGGLMGSLTISLRRRATIGTTMLRIAGQKLPGSARPLDSCMYVHVTAGEGHPAG